MRILSVTTRWTSQKERSLNVLTCRAPFKDEIPGRRSNHRQDNVFDLAFAGEIMVETNVQCGKLGGARLWNSHPA